VPVLFTRRGPHGIRRREGHDGAVTGRDQASSVGAEQSLPQGVRVPVGACTRGEPHDAGDQARRLGFLLDRVDVDVAGERGVAGLGGGTWRVGQYAVATAGARLSFPAATLTRSLKRRRQQRLDLPLRHADCQVD